ncbi:MAG: hypothetical protein M3487_02590, partial [Actinomycetota bacterium]|nr:hypothetical protein [Actinomycetota bacterium]
LDVDLGRLLTPLPVRRGSPVLIMAPLAQPTGLAAWAAAVVQECPTVLTARDGATAAQQLAAEHGVGLIVPADAG